MVHIEGERPLAASCLRTPDDGMVVETQAERATAARNMVIELLLADQPARETAPDPQSKFWQWADRTGVAESRLPARENGAAPAADSSHPAMAVNLDACIHCNLCVRACREVQVNDVIGMAARGANSKIVFDFDDPMGNSTCVACGECVQACPTGALLPATMVDEAGIGIGAGGAGGPIADRTVDSICPYCGVGCQLTYHIKDDRIVKVDGRDGPANENRLCVKGRFGFDYVHHPHRLTTPLIRKEGVGKRWDDEVDPADPSTHFREASWEEALDAAAKGLRRVADDHGGQAIAGFGSAKGSNEEAYLFQKLIRTAFKTNNVDHCTRLCHASSVAALMETIGSGAVTAPFTAAEDSDCIIVIGARPTENHPVAATYLKQAAKRGAKLIVMDPRGYALTRHADHFVQFKPGSDVALLNAMMHTILDEGLADEQYIAGYTENFDALKQKVLAFPPEDMAAVCGVDAQTIRTIARTYATAERAIIFWGMGIAQHVHGTDNARCLISLALLTGQIGRPGTGLHPLRGQNNVQGASDAGLIPMVYPDYQAVSDPAARQRFESLWGVEDLDPNAGLTVVEIMDAARDGKVRGMYVMGDRPCPTPTSTMRARASPRSIIWWCRRFSSPKPPPMPTSFCRPRPGRRNRARSPTPTGRCRSAGRRCPCPAKFNRIGGSFSNSPSGSASAGPTAASSRCSTSCARPCIRSTALPGNGCSAKTPSPIPATRWTSRARRSCSPAVSPPPRAAASSCRPKYCRPTNCPTATTPWC
jgi:formate dehydrogenase major subunit